MNVPVQLPAEPGEEAPGETEFRALLWRTRRTPYLVLFIGCYLAISGMIYLALKDKDAAFILPFFGPLFAAPAWNFLWLFLSGSSFRLVDDRLDILAGDKTRSIALKDVVVLQSSLSKTAKDEAAIIVATEDRRFVIPRCITNRSDRIYRELCDRIEFFQAAQHRSDALPDDMDLDAPPPAGPWARYPDLPREIRELLDEQKDRGHELGVLVFGGPVKKNARTALTFLRKYAIWMAVLGIVITALMALNSNPSQATMGLVFAGIGGVIAALTFIRGNHSRKTEWFVVHPDGIAMMGSHLTGELAWKNISMVHLTPPKTFLSEGAPRSPTDERFAIETRDGARIVVPDIYDAPLFLVARCVRQFWGEHKKIELNQTMAAKTEG